MTETPIFVLHRCMLRLSNLYKHKPSGTEKRNFMTPYPSSKQDRRPSKVTPSYSEIAPALLVFNLASNAASHSSLRPKRKSYHAPSNISIYLV